MEFVSADRSRDAEFIRGLQNYNQQVFNTNKDIAAKVDDTRDQLDQDISNAKEVADLDNLKTSGALAGIAAGGGEKVIRGVKDYNEYRTAKAAKKAADLALAARGGGTEVAVSAEEILAGPGGRFTQLTPLLGDPRAERSAALGTQSIRDTYSRGARPNSPVRTRQPQSNFTEQEQSDFRRGVEERGAAREGAAGGEGAEAAGGARGAVKTALSEAELVAEQGAAKSAGKVLAKGAGVLARGAGVAGALVSGGSAIESLVSGDKFEWDKQGAEIGGALLDILGTGAEFIPGGQLFGVGLQLAGTALSGVGTVTEALEAEPQKEEAIGEAKDLQAKTQADLEAQRERALSGITSAAQGGAAVARQVQ
tara:strand:- start:1993 stop:3090 length:1098 start_codon:yes stop_codon:yes gene_type:complete